MITRGEGLVFLKILLFILVLFLSNKAFAESFHLSNDNCDNCHIDIKNYKLLKDGPNKVCENCHPNVHPSHKIGMKVRINRENLPLDEEGNITCAYTCHNVHPKNNKDFEKKLLRMEVNKICFSCHNK